METVAREELLATIRRDRAEFDRALDLVPRERMTDPALPGGWSVKDVLAHIAWGEREALGMVRARALVGSDLWNLPQDDRNEAVIRESRARDLDDVLTDYRAAYEEFVAAMEELSDDELNDPTRFPGLVETIPGWLPWRVLYDPDHYADHGASIREAFGKPA